MLKLKSRLPDFDRVRAAVTFQPLDEVPNFDPFVHPVVLSRIFGCPVTRQLEDELVFRPQLHYDFIYLIPPYCCEPEYSRRPKKQMAGRKWVDQHANRIADFDDLAAFHEYPDPAKPVLNLDGIDAGIRAARAAPGKLGIGVLLPSCPFTECNLVMGYEAFALALYDNFELCHALVKKFGEVGLAEARELSKLDLDFVLFGDDQAYVGGLMVAPDMMRELFFPYYRKYVEILKDSGKLVFFHSDGDISPLLPDWADIGISGINPIEPAAMDIVKLQREYAGKFALLGNIDVDILARGTPEEVAALTCRRISELKPGSGWMLGSSNSICDYVRPENYLAMLETNQNFGGHW
jgi:hypothetical protein